MTAVVLGGPVLPWDGEVLCRGTPYSSLLVDGVVQVEGERFLLVHPAVDVEDHGGSGTCVAMKGAVMVVRAEALLACTQGGFSVHWRRGIAEELGEQEARLIVSWMEEARRGPVAIPPRVPLWDGVVVVGMERFGKPPVDGVEDVVWFSFSPYFVEKGGRVDILRPAGGRFPFPLANAAFLATIGGGRLLVDAKNVDAVEVAEEVRWVYEAICGPEDQGGQEVEGGEEGGADRL
ncbi:MAG: hypothetical protein ACUVS5_11860 [Anaerolineae bacterium]